jgi:hypothetical protein
MYKHGKTVHCSNRRGSNHTAHQQLEHYTTVFHNLTRLFTVIKNRCQTTVVKKQKQKIERFILFYREI